MRHTTDELIQKYRSSGLTQKKFSIESKIPLSTLQYHLHKSKKNIQVFSGKNINTTGFVRLTPRTTTPDITGNTVIIIRGSVIPQQIAEIVRALGSRC